MKYAEIKKNDIANGPGVRVSVFVSGCRHRCEDCFNEIAWDFSYGNEFDEKIISDILEYAAPSYIKGISFLGGEPFEKENQAGLLALAKAFKEKYPEKDIWCYSGFTYEELTGEKKSRASGELATELLSYIDVLVDGRYDKTKRNIMLRFRGSENQRLIDLNATRKNGIVTLWEYNEPSF